MTKAGVIYTVIGWRVWVVIQYYFLPYFIVALLWIAVSFLLLVVASVQILKLIKEWRLTSKPRVLKVFVFSILFYFTFNRRPVELIMENIDWSILYGRRMEIVERVKRKELNPNVNWNSVLCELPFEFPVVSNGGNDILIYRIGDSEALTVTFWTFRNFFSAPSSSFVYTNDKTQMLEFDKLIFRDPDNNWKITENWYRTFGE